MDFGQEIIDYFLTPTATGYTVSKTLAYSLVLIVAVYGIFRLLKKLGIKVDKKLVISIIPFIVFGSTLRVIQDAGLVDSYFFVTPGIYLLVFIMAFSSIMVSAILDKKYSMPYYKTSFILGVISLPFLFARLDILANLEGCGLVLLMFLPWIILAKLHTWSLENKIVTLLHVFDSTVTAVSMKFFGYYEQHVFPTYFINIFGPFSFIFLKLAVIGSVLMIIDRIAKDEEIDDEFVFYVKLVIGILGAATGARDFITLVSGI